jgi:hypothetical protein
MSSIEPETSGLHTLQTRIMYIKYIYIIYVSNIYIYMNT